jgi:hypothetical protein
MMTSRILRIGRAEAGRLALRLPWLLVLLVAGGADKPLPTPRFEGRTIPDPPRQNKPWTASETKLPRFLVRATADLFEAGMADPRGCWYREVEIGNDFLIKTHAFVPPAKAGEAQRIAVGWDGVVYPAFSVGEEADLEADVRALVAGRTGPGDGRSAREKRATPERYSPIKVCLLLRLGRADLAEALFASATPWTPDTPKNDLTDYKVSFVTLANEWAFDVYDRLIAAHERADDAVALDAARRLSAFRKAVDARAEALGFQRGRPGSPDPTQPSYIRGCSELDLLLADHERRAQERPRGPVPPRGGDPSARIAALIRDLDQIHVTESTYRGDAHPEGAPIVSELIAEGEPAVDPLLDALVSDTRLTRSVSPGRAHVSPFSHVHPAHEPAYAALKGILKPGLALGVGDRVEDRSTPGGRKRLADALKAIREKNRGVSDPERRYRTLLDDAAGVDLWLEAAALIARPNAEARPPEKMGEPLRAKRDPSVSDLLARRALALARDPNTRLRPDVSLERAFMMAQSFASWDEPAAIPTIRALMKICRERFPNGPSDKGPESRLGRYIPRFTILLAKAGDDEALAEYAPWARAARPDAIRDLAPHILEPLWTNPDHPAMAAVSRSLFLDPGSPWLPLVSLASGHNTRSLDDPIISPLLCVPEFREAVLSALADKAPAGKAGPSGTDSMRYTMPSGASGSLGAIPPDAEAPRDAAAEVEFRVCDFIAWKLSRIDGAPRLALYWPEPRRDAAVAESIAYLRRYGRNLSPKSLDGSPGFPHERAYLRFPILGQPATAEDVREARAIFSLEGEGDVRAAAMPSRFPIRALPSTGAAAAPDAAGRVDRREGWVWQAEEVLRDGRWERSYGFAGPGTIARLPASEIAFPDSNYRSGASPRGLGVQVRRSDTTQPSYTSGGPVLVTFLLRNGLGVDRTAPTEFTRPSADGKPALRRGIDLLLFDLPSDLVGSTSARAAGPEARKPTRTARFDPGDAFRTLAPTESFEAMSLDLNDWFGPLAPGSYRLQATFSAVSGVEEGTTYQLPFAIGDPGPRRPRPRPRQ